MKRSVLDHLFPPPHFLQMSPVGIDISDDAVRFAELVETSKGLRIGAYGERALAPGAIEAGEIKNPEAVNRALSELAQMHRIPFARASLPEEKAYIVDLTLPKLPKEEIRGNLELQFEEHVPIPLSGSVFDYTAVDAAGDHMEVMLSALPREIADKYLSVFDGTGITPTTLEIETEAVSRVAVPKGNKGTFLVVDLELKKTGIFIVSRGAIRMTSSFAIGGEMLVKAATDALKAPRDEAITRLKREGIPPVDSPLFNGIIPSLSILRDEINKRYLFWNSHESEGGGKEPPIEQIILCGEFAVIPGLTDYFATGLRADTALANILRAINDDDRYVPELSYEDMFRYGTAIGLALPRLS